MEVRKVTTITTELAIGVLAHATLPGAGPDGDSALARLSLAALRYALALPPAGVGLTAARLYNYHREPASPCWRNLYPSVDRVAARLEEAAGCELEHAFGASWRMAPVAGLREEWLSWQAPGPRVEAPWKLYVSPQAHEVLDAFGVITRSLSQSPAEAFKVGRGIHGLLRPDKMVGYFTDFAGLVATARDLAVSLHGIKPQGVPFTAQLDEGGLLSWGLDPPRPRLAGSGQPASWRRWVTRRLAVALVAAGRSRLDSEAGLRFVLDCILREGIDPANWTPTTNLWYRDGTV